ncbi:hypothetical protein PCANC_16504 [Puccinia coronata f. sp. avenae]|uniref:Uncharacterized protein n=1 Tax=Puccinia coronata f. sp. avenae TaxID=200324 RepID=A0A2N5SR68_9BASI|nr:hypothetical protein PCANC_16504 [Puccinia coronata f. sp. avenae]
MITHVFNRGGLNTIGTAPGKFNIEFDPEMIQEPLDHSKLQHHLEETHRNHTQPETSPPVDDAPKPEPIFPFTKLLTACSSFQSTHSVVDQLISRKMHIKMKTGALRV